MEDRTHNAEYTHKTVMLHNYIITFKELGYTVYGNKSSHKFYMIFRGITAPRSSYKTLAWK